MKNSTFSAQVANNLLTVLQGYTKGIRFIALLTILCTIGVGQMWAAEETYTFTSKSWGDSSNSWTSNKDGGQLSSGRGVQVSTNYSGASATSKSEFSNVSRVIVVYSTNASKGAGTINIQIGSNSAKSYTVTTNGGTTDRNAEFSFSPEESGKAKITVNCTTNSIYVKSITIETSGGSSTPATPYTVTFNAGSGTSTESLTETSAGAGVTLPTPTIDCGEWSFAGWAEESVANQTTTAPTTLFEAGDNYKPAEDCTLYAVYTKTETSQGGETTTVTSDLSFSNTNQRTSYSTSQQVWTQNGITLTNDKASSTSNVGNYSDPARFYKSSSITVTAPGNITQIEFNCVSGYVISITGATTSGTTVTVTLDGTNNTYTVNSLSAQVRLNSLSVTYTTSGGGSTTYYHSTPDCGGATPETFTVTFDANGHGTTPAAQTIISGEKANEPNAPKETGYTFGGWYENQQCTGNQFDFNTAITADITLYAKWTIATYTIKATLEHCTSTQEIPTTYEYTGKEINWSYNITPEDGYGLPRTITFSGPTYTWDQSTGILTLTGVIKSDVTFTIAAKEIHNITWKVNGEEYTTGDPSTTVLNKEQVSKLPTNPTLDCSGKTFVGWSDKEVTDGNKPSVLFTSAGTSPQILKTTTFHAVFATLTGSGNGQNTTDILTHEINGKGNTNTSYEDFSDKSYTSDAAYAGNSANGNNNEAKGVIQLRSDKSTSGIVTTTSGGYAKSITVDWHSHTPNERTLDIYGKNEAYADASNLYGNDNTTKGTKLGSIICGTSTVLTIDGDYQYIGLRSYNGAMYINSISIVWSSSAAPTYTGYTTTCTFTAPALDAPDGLAVEDLTCSSVKLSWEKVENATGYEVVRTLNAHNTTYTTDEPSITIEGLTGGNENSWKVRAIGDGTNYSSSEYAVGENFTTLFSIKYYVDGVIWHGCDDGCAANSGRFDICETEPTKANNTFAGWATTADGAVAYQAGETINNIAANVTLHAVWSDVTYTVNWSVNGEDNPVTYTHGQDLALPSIDITPCDGMDHVGWTDELGYRHGTDILFTEAEGTVTSDATYYAVFATKTSSDGGAETTFDFSTGYTNAETVSSAIQGDITVTFDKGTNSNAPKYYESGEAIRAYGGNTITVSSTNTIISKIVITFGTSDGSNNITTDVGAFSTDTWSGEANSIVFTIDGSSGNRRIQSIAVTSSGSASYYTDYTTTCEGRQLKTPTNLQATDITHNSATLTWDEVAGARSYKVVLNGTAYNTNTNSYTTHPLKSKTDYTWTVQAIGNGTTFTDSEISAEATFTTAAAVTITWVVGADKSTTTIISGQALGALPTPATPDGCKGKTFIDWTTTRNINNDGTGITYITADIVPTENTTYYAVFAMGDLAGSANITDELTHTINGQESGTSYTEFSGKQYTSDALYAGSSANGNSAIQLRSDKSTSGIVTTTSGGYAKSITVEWNSNTADGRTLDIYGKNEAYSAASDLYNANTQGAKLGSIVNGTSTSLTIDGNYQYIGLRSKSGAMYITSITIVWQSGEVTYTDYSTSCGDFLVTYYGFTGGYSTTCDENPGEILVPQFSPYTIPDCTPTEDPKGLGRTFAGTWIDDSGKSYKPGDSFEVTKNTTLYAQWTWNTNTIPTDESGIADLATTDVVVTGGNTLTLAEGTTTINSLTLKGGLQADSTYAMPVVNIPEGATLVRNNNKINLDLKVNNKSYYPFAVPFEVENTAANVNYIDTTLKEYVNEVKGYGKYYRILEYNGALRAEKGLNNDSNWVHVGRTVKLMPGKGYAISAVPASGQDTVTIRITMNVDNAWLANGEQKSITVKEQTTTRNQVTVTAYTGKATDINNGGHQRHAGWNFVANPYLSMFAGNNASNEGGSFIIGKITINNGNYSYGGENVPYVTIPTYNFAHYHQVKLSEATLSPAYSFFVQVGDSGTMTFGRQQAPASIAARNAEERPVKMDVDITLSDNHSSDQTGIIISDRYSEAYEIGRDLEKLFGSAYNLSVYTLMADNTPLAFQALAIRSNMQVIPVGYRAPEQGEYTFRLNEATSSIDLLNEQYEQLVLVDYQTGELTNLLIADYTFYSERTQADNRFAIYAVPRQNAPTDLPNAIGQDKQAQKIIHNGHLYILRDGNVYNGNGQIVK